MRFRIEYISAGKPPYVLARQLDKEAFQLKDRTFLGGVRISGKLSQPRSSIREGAPDPAVFAFHLCKSSDRSRFQVGSVVELQTV